MQTKSRVPTTGGNIKLDRYQHFNKTIVDLFTALHVGIIHTLYKEYQRLHDI